MTDKGWKKWERYVCKLFGGRRRGADFRSNTGGGKNDCIKPGWSIECKYHKQLGYATILSACNQSEQAREHVLDIPIAVVKRPGDRNKNALVCMRLETFMKYFGGDK